MRALLTSLPAADYAASKAYYERAVGLSIVGEHPAEPHRFTNYDVGGMFSNVYEWLEPYYGSGDSGLSIETPELDVTVERIRQFGGRTTPIVVHAWVGRCCSLTDPFENKFTLSDSYQNGDI